MKYKLTSKTRYFFDYEKTEKNYNFTSVIEICQKDTIAGYKGIQVSCYQKNMNREGFNNSVGVRKPELFLIPFWILHFKFYRLFHRKGGAYEDRKR